ncbi:MAG: alpha/beta hydrolase [Prevotellaceae bacterium]|jgi:pimeloyl-ACP methyl ester carboxylesterase|nr:alpha/beta hydrolase [Prevotellaceae bacterium]
MKPTKEGFAVSNGAQIHYEVYGAGLPLALLHGNSEDSRYFDRQIPFFATHYTVVAIDSRAHGQSTRGDRPLDFHTMADDVVATLDHLSITQAALLGFSDGGNTALHVALTVPERVRALILAGANLFPKGMTRSAYAQVLAGYIGYRAGGLFSSCARAAAERWALMAFHPKLTPDDLAPLCIPILVIAGEHDMIRQTHTRLIASAIDNATLRIIPNAGHFIADKMPDLFNRTVEAFLKSTEYSGTSDENKGK